MDTTYAFQCQFLIEVKSLSLVSSCLWWDRLQQRVRQRVRSPSVNKVQCTECAEGWAECMCWVCSVRSVQSVQKVVQSACAEGAEGCTECMCSVLNVVRSVQSGRRCSVHVFGVFGEFGEYTQRKCQQSNGDFIQCPRNFGEDRKHLLVISLANKGGNEWKRFCQGHFLIVSHDHLECVILVSLYHSAEKQNFRQHIRNTI